MVTICAASVENAVLGDWGETPQQAKDPGVRTGTLLATTCLTPKRHFQKRRFYESAVQQFICIFPFTSAKGRSWSDPVAASPGLAV